ncbi:MAG: hypothetical protein EOO05_17140 [Chitinophagaceae bacterium]|nr:MAG: hypothetical protein EOO05_17140 [Chitinophagaceae bacterium]
MRYLFCLFCLLALNTVFSQPHITGKVTISQSTGLIACDLTLSNLPSLANYRILLNHGMNIQYFTGDSSKQVYYDGWYGGKMKGESLEYVLMKNDNDTMRPLPPSFRVKYRGAFPVYNDTVNLFDFKGLVAFNGKTLRATEQTKWYPVIYDVANDRLIDNYTYDIVIDAADSRTVYLNGAAPSQVKNSRFVSVVPRGLFLFAGDYDFMKSGNNYILNASIDAGSARQIFSELDRIKSFHAKNLGITYNEGVYIISHKAVKKFNPGGSWGFTVFPSFAYANLDFTTLVGSNGKFGNDNLAFFAHELSHYYFGDRMISGPLAWFWLESTTEYLSLKAAEAMADTGYYKKIVNRYTAFTKTQKYKPLNEVTAGDIDENYRYVYGPLIWIAFEKTFGIKKTYAVLAGLIHQAETQTLTLQLLKKVSVAAGIGESGFDKFYGDYLQGDAALSHVVDKAGG